MQLNIGSIKLPHAAVLAPMSGITDQPSGELCGH